MQYALIILEAEEQFATRKHPEDPMWPPWRAYHQSLVDAGVYVGGRALQGNETGTVVRIRGGERQVQDGPYADTKEQLGGFIVIEAPSLDVALEWASRCPAAAYGAVEVRPVAHVDAIFGTSETSSKGF
jgi:hypothetical protein